MDRKIRGRLALGLAMGIAITIPLAGQGPGGGQGGGTGGGTTGGGAGTTGPGGAGGAGGTGGIGGRTQPGQQSPLPGQDQSRFPDQSTQRPVFLSGKVMLEDGTAPPEPVTIERVCNGRPIPEGYTDSKGRFSFELGRNQSLMQDAAYGSATDDPFSQSPGLGNQTRASSTRPGMGGASLGGRDLMGCELRAVLPGFRSEVVNLSGRRMFDNPDVGTIILRRLANVEGT
ncbi:MAG: hypothetical protein HYR60_31185, partial [Acidobacteria bacterium]|nr:hypothetical protein [Acidobacteriota bacterium]